MRILAILVTSACLSSAAWAQTTYWLPGLSATDTEKTYTYGTRLPDALGKWLADGGKRVTRGTDKGDRSFVDVGVDWDTSGGRGPTKDGWISLHVKDGYGYKWFPNGAPELKGDAALGAALDAAIVKEFNTWRAADLVVLESQGADNPGVTLRIPISMEDQLRARMRKIAETTVPGQFYPNEVQRPADLDAMRREILALGNLGRRDPNFRKDNKYANDLSGDTATSDRGPDKIYRNNPTAPYFNDLVLHPKLNEACQFMAEYYARTKGNAQMPSGKKHDAPGVKWDNAKMDTVTDRIRYFAPGVGSAGEGLAGAEPPDSEPTGWMKTETHYRPWFNLGADVKSMGIGAARTSDGWYFCKLAGTDLPEGVTQPTPTASPAIPLGGTTEPPKAGKPIDSGKPVASPPPALTETPADARQYVGHIGQNQYMTKDNPYHSNGMGMYLMHQSDGNLVIKRASDHMFVWGLNEQPGVNYQEAAKVAHVGNRLVAYDAKDQEIWSTPAPDAPAEHVLMLTNDGTLMVFPATGNKAPYWTSRKTNWSFDGIQPGQELARGTRSYAVRNLDKVPTGAGGQPLSGEQLYSFRSFYMELQHDGNFVIKSADEKMAYVWGLDQVPGLDLGRIDRMRMRKNGRLVALDAAGAVLWAVPKKGAVPGSRLNLALDGTLQLVTPGFDRVVWQNR